MKRQECFNKLFENGISYEEYVKKSEKYRERMNDIWTLSQKVVQRLYQEKISRMNEKLHVLCIAENWCIDCANGVPIIALLADMTPNWDFCIVSRDVFREEFEMFYQTAGRKKIPVILFADEDGDEILRWVEKPTRSYQQLSILRDKTLSKEEFIQKYNDTVEFQPAFVSQEILNEVIPAAEKAVSIAHFNPPSRKRSKIV
ncbi:MAG: thioredoxin family protein [Candidatus Hodarchaeales archaeon]|jgi:hypothetical protein